MGNQLSSSPEYFLTSFNQKLSKSIQSKFQLLANIPQMNRGKILNCFLNLDLNLCAVHSSGADIVCLDGTHKHNFTVTGNSYVGAAGHSEDQVVLSLNTGVFALLSAFTLASIKTIKPESLLPGAISFLQVLGNEFVSGHSSGIALIWEVSSGKVSQELSSGPPYAPVKCFAASEKHQLVILGFETNKGSLEVEETRNVLKVFSRKNLKCLELRGLNEKCVGVKAVDKYNLVVGVGERSIGVWDILTGQQLSQIGLPDMYGSACCLSDFKECLLIGFNSGLGWGELKFSDKDLKYVVDWKGRAAWSRQVSVIKYEARIDSVVLGDSIAGIGVLNNVSVAPPKNPKPPLFSLQSYQSSKPAIKKQEDLPLISIGNFSVSLTEENHEDYQVELDTKETTRQISYETIEKIRNRVEGKKPSRKEVSKSSTEEVKEITDGIVNKALEEVKQPTQEPVEGPVEETKEETKPSLTPFQRFLNAKKQQILQGNSQLTHKQIVMEATKLWVKLTKEEKSSYEQAPDVTS